MGSKPLGDAFAHHVWATFLILDACDGLTPEQLQTNVPGTYGTILDTVRHLVGADRWYLHVMSDRRIPGIDEDTMDLPALRAVMEENGPAWTELLAGDPDPDHVIEWHRQDGSQTDAPFGIRLAQAVHHGTDHRSQIATALTTLGIEPPLMDVWDYGETVGRTVDTPPTA